jgi:hypothetical protein
MFEVVVGLVSAALLTTEALSEIESFGAVLILAAGASEFFVDTPPSAAVVSYPPMA